MEIPQLGNPLTEKQKNLLSALTKSCRRSIIEMTTNANSGHPGGSLSSIDYLTLFYAFIISQTGNKAVISHGHISPAVYSILAEMGYIPREEVVSTFRKAGSIYEGHITRHVPGIWYGTGPLGVGVSVGAGFAWAGKHEKKDEKVFVLLGDGEAQEGQVHEMIHFAKQHKLGNLVAFVDNNKVQLTDSLKEVMDIDIRKTFEAGHWHVIDVDGHNFDDMWKALAEANTIKDKPVVLIGHTIMGKGVEFMEKDGLLHKATWHGKAASKEDIENALDHSELHISAEEQDLLTEFKKEIKWHPEKSQNPELLEKNNLDTGEPILYGTEEITDCRTAYGKALLDLAKRNTNVLALTADLKGSVMTKFVSEELPEQYIECGIAEQNMVSVAGGLSLIDYIPFASTFGAFMSSRAKDQARVNDINHCNVKMVATHCGLSVGEDGPTHQAIDDMGSFLGMFNTMIIEPADPNHTDRIIRYIASHHGNFYVRMGRHKFPIITKEDGTPFYDENYVYQYGNCDLIREGKDLTIAASGAMVINALQAINELKTSHPELSIELIAVSAIKNYSEEILTSVKKTKKLLTVEDHNVYSGLGSMLASHLQLNGIHPEKIKILGVEHYQLSGTADELYRLNGLDSEGIAKSVLGLV